MSRVIQKLKVLYECRTVIYAHILRIVVFLFRTVSSVYLTEIRLDPKTEILKTLVLLACEWYSSCFCGPQIGEWSENN